MPDPTTSNILLAIPTRGSDVGTWDLPVNGDFAGIDGYFGGVQTISLSNTNVTLTAPTGTATPSGGPTQSQNAVLRFTGALSANVQIVLPLPGYYIIENLTTNPNFVVQFRAIGTGEVICVDQGEIQHIYNDGTNVRFVNLGRIGNTEIWGGLASMPIWVGACTKRPYLLCDGGVYNVSDFPYLGARLQGNFGGNGVTTFGVPDLRGRVPLPYDGTGTRITAAVCGINGQQMGGAADNQGITLNAGQIPTITAAGVNNISVVLNGASGGQGVPVTSSPGNIQPSQRATQSGAVDATSTAATWGGASSTSSGNNTINVSSNNTGGQSHSNVQPAQVTGIAVIRAA